MLDIVFLKNIRELELLSVKFNSTSLKSGIQHFVLKPLKSMSVAAKFEMRGEGERERC